MGTKGKNGPKGPNPKGPPPIIQRDLLQRINFSQQASIYLQSLADGEASSHRSEGPAVLSRAPEGYIAVGDDRDVLGKLARDQMRGAKRLTVHNQLKLDPSFKRTICSFCNFVLVPGLTSRLRNRPDKNHINVTHHTCLQCSQTLTLPCPPTSMPNDKLDGPSRRSRRRRAANRAKIVFFEKEGGGGHTLWQGQSKVDRWGQGSGSPAKNEDENTA